MPLWVLSGNHVFFSKFCANEKSSISQNTPLTSTEEGQTRATSYIIACSPPTASLFLWRLRLASYHSQLLLSGRRKPLNATHGTTTTMQQSKLLSFPSLSWVDLVLPFALCRSSWSGKIACDHQDFF